LLCSYLHLFCRMKFTLEHTDAHSRARAARLVLPHGEVQTPVFMPVGTQATVKSLTSRDVDELGAQMLLGNTYHLHLRPGSELISRAGGLHAFMGWHKPILTDSGGYQVYSLARLRRLSNDGVTFQSHIDGSACTFTPEKVVQIQEQLGVDIMMQLDECPPAHAAKKDIERAVDRSLNWARRSRDAWSRSTGVLFGIAQGGLHDDLRCKSIEHLVALELPGYALGGFSVGENMHEAYPVIERAAGRLPVAAPRYLMGIGFPEDIVRAVAAGIDMFDCVLPTRCARNGMCFTSRGRLRIKNARYRNDMAPIDEACTCYTCRTFSRAYLRHLCMAHEITGSVLMTIHNIHYYLELCRQMRSAILADSFKAFSDGFFRSRHPA
jgi:queuine tRNA-ribosyltransferase